MAAQTVSATVKTMQVKALSSRVDRVAYSLRCRAGETAAKKIVETPAIKAARKLVAQFDERKKRAYNKASDAAARRIQDAHTAVLFDPAKALKLVEKLEAEARDGR